MSRLKIFSKEHRDQLTHIREGETKFGEKINLVEGNLDTFLQNTSAKYILFGVPEDIGVKANFGRTGARYAWEYTLKALLNIQHNHLCCADKIAILGAFDFSEWQKEADQLSVDIPQERAKLFELVEKVDCEVYALVEKIIKANKKPIVIGGGHNNAYGNIKGLSLGKNKKVNVINFDAHTDFRPLEGRHSGNGFSYAFDELLLEKYFIFGLHENYTSQSVYQSIEKTKGRVKYNTLEEMKVYKTKKFENELKTARNFIKNKPYGIELDLDSVENVWSSAITPTGFSSLNTRRFVNYMAQHPNACYLHICEAAPNLGDDKNIHLTGKLSAYLITDFIKAQEN